MNLCVIKYVNGYRMRRDAAPGSGAADSGVVRSQGAQRHRVLGHRGQEVQPGAQAHGTHLLGGVASASSADFGNRSPQPLPLGSSWRRRDSN